jgi:hypothetical protein
MVFTGGSTSFHEELSGKLSITRGRPTENTASAVPSNWNQHSQKKSPAIPERSQPGTSVVGPKLSTAQRYDPSSPMNTSQLRTRQDPTGFLPSSQSTFGSSNFSYHMGAQNNNGNINSLPAYYVAPQHQPETLHNRRSSKPSDINTYNPQPYDTKSSSQDKYFK